MDEPPDDYVSDDLSSTKETPKDDSINPEPDYLPTQLYRLLLAYGLTTTTLLQLVSMRELQGLHTLGSVQFPMLLEYYHKCSIKPRPNEVSVAAKAAELYGSILRAPVTIALVSVFPLQVCRRGEYQRIRSAVASTGATTVGQLLEVLSCAPEIPGLAQKHHAMLCEWLAKSIFY